MNGTKTKPDEATWMKLILRKRFLLLDRVLTYVHFSTVLAVVFLAKKRTQPPNLRAVVVSSLTEES